jgi:hypothetical protein
MPENLGNIHPVDPHAHPLPNIQLIPPVKGLSTLKDTPGVSGDNTADGDGVLGETSHAGIGVHGAGDAGIGVLGECNGGRGVVGVSKTATGVEGDSTDGIGVWGTSVNSEGIHAETHSTVTAALAAYQKNPASDSAALYAKHDGRRTAAFFEGNVLISGHIEFLQAADCAEDFDISAESCAEPGTVMALDDEGNLRESCQPYDKRVAGVISGAGSYKPGLVLDKQQAQHSRRPIALLGKVFCKVDAQFGCIKVGDLLTTSPTVGHAMRADDPVKAFGSVIGKALRPQADGQGLIPILIALQ